MNFKRKDLQQFFNKKHFKQASLSFIFEGREFYYQFRPRERNNWQVNLNKLRFFDRKTIIYDIQKSELTKYSPHLPYYDLGYFYKRDRYNNIQLIQRYFFLIADFDDLPTDVPSFDYFERYLKETYNNAIITRSMSNKCKVYFFCECDIEMRSNDFDTMNQIRLQLIEKLLLPQDYFVIDKNISALRTTFMNYSMVESFKSQVKNLKLFKVSELLNKKEVKEVKKDSKEIAVNNLPERIYQIINQLAKRSESKLILSRMFTFMMYSDYTEIMFPIEKFGNPRTVYRLVKKLLSHGIIIKVGDYNYHQKIANKFILNKEMIKIKEEFLKDKSLLKLENILPIRDGEWNIKLFLLTKIIKDKEEYMTFVKNLEGINKKDRLHKASIYYNRYT